MGEPQVLTLLTPSPQWCRHLPVPQSSLESWEKHTSSQGMLGLTCFCPELSLIQPR